MPGLGQTGDCIVPDVSSHAPGTFSWVELATTDPKAAVSFYRSLFGWGVVEHDMGPDGVYTIFTMRDRDVAAAAAQQAQERQMGVPPRRINEIVLGKREEVAEGEVVGLFTGLEHHGGIAGTDPPCQRKGERI